MGVLSALVSWNYPFHNLYGQVISAIYSGNAIVVKVLRAHPIQGTPCSLYPRYSVHNLSKVLRSHPIQGTLCSPYPRYSVLTSTRYSVLTLSKVLRAHPTSNTPLCFHRLMVCALLYILGAPCCSWCFMLPYPRYSVVTPPKGPTLTPSYVPRSHAIIGTPLSTQPRCSALTLS